ncbi:hypothetical protein PUN71_022590 [Arthrobacter sp. NQ7]|uniref:hypothetical protein n=1 Tax=Arthrobacter sp. NQ7 TaxID=3032303 RepID=UPI00240F9C30|nr:hypothetical protein [Arthrobacter sp. NQ7]MDJ0460001.1 hypothetical protein [Arthrobacter sp. NQ7]
MGADSSNSKPMFERTERWATPLSADAALRALSNRFIEAGARVTEIGDGLEIRQGSNWRYRLWGNLFKKGRRSVPVALTLRLFSTKSGTYIEAHAFDTFGFRLAEHAFFGAQETFDDALENMLAMASAAADVTTRSR